MDFFNQLASQLRDLFASMTPGARITAGLLLAVVVVSLAFLFQQSSAGPDHYLFGGEALGMRDINKIRGALGEAGLGGYEVEGNRIRVPRGNKDAYVAAIASAGALPADFASLMDDGLANAGMFETRQQWSLRAKSIRENQLAHTIGLMPWVEYATVMYEIEEPIGLKQNHRASASVFVMPLPGESLDKSRMRNLQKFVAGWHPSLKAENVIVSSGGGEFAGDGEATFDDPLMQARDEFERDKRNELLRQLSHIAGVRVEVSAEFENLVERTVVDVKSGTPQPLSETSVNESVETISTDGGGRPGLPAQGPSRTGTDSQLAREQRSTTKNSTSTTENVVPKISESALYKGFIPKEVFASVAIPRTYIADVWRQQNPDKAEETPTANNLLSVATDVTTTVENLVKPLLPKLSLGEDEYKQVNVEIIDPIPPAPVEPPSMTTHALSWAGQYWPTVSLVGLAAFSLLMMRSVVAGGSKSPDKSPTLELDIPATAEGKDGSSKNGDEDDDDGDGRPRLKLRKDRSLKDDLAEIVRDDPESAAAILRGWIGKAG